MKITTKTGDGGETGLFGGGRVKKNSAFMWALGDLDELNSVLGWAKREVPEGVELLERVQDDVYKIMSFIGSKFKWHPHIEPISELDIEFLESEVAKYEETVGGLSKFIRPGVNEAAARLHIARSVCRRAERSYVNVLEDTEESLDKDMVLKYLNRLSDLLFVMAYDKETS